ncbi:MAG: hypothetical protein M3Y85_06350 [Bacteroidota bacterium]|nr:hypothetical protein [Bacteroidota bacterium]
MNDTPEHIKQLQLQIWLSKPPGERLRQFLVDNDALYGFLKIMKEEMVKKYPAEKAPAQ